MRAPVFWPVGDRHCGLELLGDFRHRRRFLRPLPYQATRAGPIHWHRLERLFCRRYLAISVGGSGWLKR